MRPDVAVARYVMRLLLRSRLALLLGGAGLALIAGSFVLTWLTPGTERRTFLDAAFLGIEWLAILAPVLGSTILQVQEFDQRTLWLVLVRPPGRGSFARGRFLGLAWSGCGIVLACGLVLAGLVAAAGGLPEPYLVPVLAAACGEVVVLSAIGGLVTFATTSYLTALLVQLGIVVLGYLSPVLPYLAQKVAVPALKPFVWAVYWLMPHLSDFAVREFTEPAESWYLAALAGYAVLYAVAVVGVSAFVFRRRDV
jgi:ABC-type transport system involved in multi-copper enzyme maturation permease subunit